VSEDLKLEQIAEIPQFTETAGQDAAPAVTGGIRQFVDLGGQPSALDEEIWKPIPWPADLPQGETPPYDASSHGQIRNRQGLILQQRDHNRPKDGPPFYQRVNLSYAGRKDPGRLVHQLVLLAFEGPPPPGKPHIRHLDDNPTNNFWAPGGEGGGTNLVYGTPEENEADKERAEAKTQREEAAAGWLTSYLDGCGGKARYWEVRRAAAAAGIGLETLYAARSRCGVAATQITVWNLPAAGGQPGAWEDDDLERGDLAAVTDGEENPNGHAPSPPRSLRSWLHRHATWRRKA
jgi:hypothetical protein